MPYLYLLQLSYENVAVLSSKKKVEFNVGKIFSKNNIKSVILSKKEFEVDFLIFLNITFNCLFGVGLNRKLECIFN